MIRVIFYHRDNCQPCRQAEPRWDQLQQDYVGRVDFQKVEVEFRTAGDFGIQGTPSFAVENSGQRINLVTGGDFVQLRAFIEDALQATGPMVDPKPETKGSNTTLIGIGVLISLLILSRINS